ncbi:MAG: flavodoxin family protein [Spirochaetia bacterium]|nr:flavodoxin family protein [Spirochaetia bacterium]
MYVVAFNGSARPEGNTAFFIEKAFEPLRAAGVECERVSLAGGVVRGCTACMTCRETGDGRCVYDDDIINTCIEKMKRADAIIIGSPVYFSDITSETKALIDRAGYAIRGSEDGNPLSRKVGAGISVARRAGTVHALQSINQFFFINDMVVPGSSYWNMSLSRAVGDGEQDTEGSNTMLRLGENIAWLIKKLNN